MLISGKEISAAVRAELLERTNKLKEKGRTPGLAVILVGEDPASKVYVNNKEKACFELGFYSEKYLLSENTSEEELLALIDRLNEEDKIHGILVQLPLPSHLNEKKVTERISPVKDVDCFHPVNIGKVLTGEGVFAPCTPAGVMEMLKFSGIDVAGKNAVVIGRSNIVGKPMAMLLLKENATVTICHSKTKDLKEHTSKADILIAAVGRANFVKADMVKEGAVVIDVGINRNEDGKLCGDVDFSEVSGKASYISPVPGGVGPMTITELMKNTLLSAEENLKNF
ncbi:MAG: bifunctional methylenetetrahydrofolate dehydrogenase/methenyltetrahydrofolate cyclohydrolase FolD [Oscillospiraceae bacterium]|nr:bifunctional methylenetetrahydrofolate dehydrogenase/methenyltetrahydrofolate cyclohydrolase FolD [Oscillospiraceae bacterium]